MGSRSSYLWLVVKLMFAAGATLMVTVVLFFLLAGFIVSGGRPVQVPNLIGDTIVDALAELEGTGLKLDPAISRRYSSIVPQNSIISQDPSPGRMVKSTRTVRVVLSRGPEMIRVPDVTGGDVRQAVVSLADVGLRPEAEVRVHYAARPEIVVGQDPPAGSLLERDSGVHLLVSQGARRLTYVMPELVGKSLDEVVEILSVLNLKIRATREPREDMPEDVVFYQDPLPGTAIVEGDTVEAGVSVSQRLTQLQSREGLIIEYEPLGLRLRIRLPPLQTYEGLIIRYDVPEGLVQRRVRVDVQDAASRGTEFDNVVDPGSTVTIPVLYEKWLEAEIRLDGRVVERRFVGEGRDVVISTQFFEHICPQRLGSVQWRP